MYEFSYSVDSRLLRGMGRSRDIKQTFQKSMWVIYVIQSRVVTAEMVRRHQILDVFGGRDNTNPSGQNIRVCADQRTHGWPQIFGPKALKDATAILRNKEGCSWKCMRWGTKIQDTRLDLLYQRCLGAIWMECSPHQLDAWLNQQVNICKMFRNPWRQTSHTHKKKMCAKVWMVI